MGVREHSPSPAPPGTPDGSSRPGPGSPPAHCPPQASLLSGVTPGLPTSLAPHSGATGFPAGLDGVASSRGTHRRLWGLGVGGTFSPGTRIFQSKQRLWDVCVGSLASAWGACSLGVSLAWSSVNCSHGLGFRNLVLPLQLAHRPQSLLTEPPVLLLPQRNPQLMIQETSEPSGNYIMEKEKRQHQPHV